MLPNNKTIQSVVAIPWLPYVAPFVLFLLLTEPARHFPELGPYLYIIKTVAVAALLWFWRHRYATDLKPKLNFKEVLTACGCGLLALIIWVVPEGYLFQLEQKSIFDPQGLGHSQLAVITLISIRLLGAVLVVPIMEELFWRSFLMRYLISSDFRSIQLGAFSWLSFMSVAILFGLEHNRIMVGIIVGILYNLLLVKQGKLWGVILAHAVTNLGLGIYVMTTGRWIFW